MTVNLALTILYLVGGFATARTVADWHRDELVADFGVAFAGVVLVVLGLVWPITVALWLVSLLGRALLGGSR